MKECPGPMKRTRPVPVFLGLARQFPYEIRHMVEHPVVADCFGGAGMRRVHALHRSVQFSTANSSVV